MVSKMSVGLLLLIGTAFVFQTTEAIFFTLGGAAVDLSIAFFVFEKFLCIPWLFLGKRSVDNPNPFKIPNRFGSPARPQEYLDVAVSMDTDKCLPIAVCAAMAKSRDPISNKTKFDTLVIEHFQRKINEPYGENITPLSYYIEAAKFGQSVGVVESCREVSPTCKYSISELNQLTAAVSQYQL